MDAQKVLMYSKYTWTNLIFPIVLKGTECENYFILSLHDIHLKVYFHSVAVTYYSQITEKGVI